MDKEKRIECPFCSELILPDAEKCRFCKEWISKCEEFIEEVVQSSPVEEDSSEVDKVFGHEGGGGFRWGVAFRVSLALFYVALIVAGVFYEAKAREVLDYAREMEEKKKYEVARLAYQTIAKKYPLSYVASEAIVGFSRINTDFLSFELPEFEVTFLERLFGGRFDSCYHYGLPLFASLVCFVACFLMVLVRVFQLRMAVFALFLIVFSGLFLMVQVAAYGWASLSGPFFDVSVRIMKSYEGVYVAGYMLLFMTAIETLRGKKK